MPTHSSPPAAWLSSCEGARVSLTAFTCTELTIPLALTPNLREDSVSAALSRDGEQQTIKAVLAVPPKESCTVHQFIIKDTGDSFKLKIQLISLKNGNLYNYLRK